MLHKVLLSAAATLALCLLTACGPSIQADLSPDGRTLVQADTNGLTLRKLDGGPSQRLLRGSISEPKFSPDGRTVAVERFGRSRVDALLVDVATRKTTALSGGLRGPFAWRPNGAELIAWYGKVACVYNVRSRKIVRKIPFPDAPRKVCWLSGDRGIVAASERRIMVLGKGKVRAIVAKEAIAGLGYDPMGDRVVWTEARQVDPMRTRISAFAVSRQGGPKVLLMKERDCSQVVGAESPFAIPISLSIAPNGKRIALAALIEAAPVGRWQRLADLEARFRRNPNDKALLAELRRRQQNLQADLTIATAPIEGTATSTLTRRPLRKVGEWPSELVWSAKGDRLALVADQGVEVVHVK